MFLWTTPFGLRTFGQTLEHAQVSATLAMNQGLYNGFLAAGLIWSLLSRDKGAAFNLKIFFLSCVLVAAIFGGATVSPKIMFVQGAPALLALGLTWFGRSRA
jgi:putative membrane protein